MEEKRSLGTTPSITGLRVLVAEDNEINLELCLQYLDDLGLEEVQSAGDGEEVLRMLEAEPGRFDVILMDVRMPRLDGLATTREILKRWPESDARPGIVAITAQAFEEERRNCLRAGMDFCLSKPLRLRDLESALGAWITRGRSAEFSAAPEAEETTSGNIDWSQFEKVVEDAFSPCVAIFHRFCETVPELLEKIRAAAAAGDAGEAGSVAHQLKGSSSSFGLTRIAGAMAEIEAAARTGGDVSRFSSPQWEAEMKAAFARDRANIRDRRGI